MKCHFNRKRAWQMTTWLLLLSFVIAPVGAAPTQGAVLVKGASPSILYVDGLTIDGRADNPLGVDDTTPNLGWRVSGGTQTAYEIRAASSVALLATPDLWDSGKVTSSQSFGILYGGAALTSRQPVVWQVRVWDDLDFASDWSAPALWEMGLLNPNDWGAAKWIEYPGWTEAQPLPIFARAFTPADGKTVRQARLYLSGAGPFVASLNGKSVTDEVLAPGYTNLQLEAEYHTYDVTSLLTSGSNTLGVQLGNGMENRSRTVSNPATGRTSNYAWNQSSATGSGTLAAPAAAGATSVRPSTVSNYSVDATINVDTGNGGDNLESRTITGVFPAASTTLVVPAAAGNTNVKVASVNNFAVSGTLRIDTGATVETVTTTAVGTPAGSTTLVAAASAGDTKVYVASVNNFTNTASMLIDTGGISEPVTISAVGTAAAAATTLFAPAAVGDTNVKVASTTGFTTSQPFILDTGANLEMRTVTAVGTQGRSTTLAAASTTLAVTSTSLLTDTHIGDTVISVGSNSGFSAGQTIGIDSGANLESATIISITTIGLPLPSYSATPVANWIWNTADAGTSAPGGTIYVRKTFTVTNASALTAAALRINVDDEHDTYVNGTLVASSHVANGWRTSQFVDIRPLLVTGANVIAVAATNGSGAGSMISAAQIDTSGGSTRIVSDATWKALAGTPATPPVGWNTAAFDDSAWPAAFISGAYPMAPWNVLTDPPSMTTYNFTLAAPLTKAHAAGALLGAITPVGMTNLKVASVTGFAISNTISIDTGANMETAMIAAVGTAGATGTGITLTTPTALAHTGAVTVATIVAVAGSTNVKVASVTGISVTDTMLIDYGTTGVETRTVAAVGTAGATGTGVTLTLALASTHFGAAAVRTLGSGITFTPTLSLAHAVTATIRALGSGITFAPALNLAHASGVTVTTPGSGISFTPALAFAHPVTATVAQLIAITFSPALSLAHASGAAISGSGRNRTDTTATAGARVTTRLIGRIEITYTDGSVDTIVSDRNWGTALGPTVTSMWYAGTDYDARREQPGWDAPGADLSAAATRRNGSPTGWIAAGIAPAPNLATQLIWHQGPPVEIVRTFTPISVTQPVTGTWVFDFGQNFAGWPELHLSPSESTGTGSLILPPGAVVRMQPAESLNADGTVSQGSLGPGGSRGTNLFNAYITYGNPAGETWRPQFQYFGMQYVQVTGLPAGYTPTANTITGLQLRGANEQIGSVTTSDARINRIHQMALYSFMSNMMAQFTDCPGREKQSYPADYSMVIDSIDANFDLDAYLRWQMVLMVSSQLQVGADIGNIALKNPTYDVGSTGTFGNDPNWGGTILFAAWRLYTEYGNVETMRDFYPQMKAYLDFITNRTVLTGADAYINTANLGDWVAGEATNTSLIGTWAYYRMANIMAQAAALTGHDADVATYTTLAANIKTAFNNHYFNHTLHRYTSGGDASTTGATQAAQAVALDADLVPDGERQNVLNALVELVYAYHPYGGGPHLSGGTVGLAPTIRALAAGGRDDVLWDTLQEDTRPSYGYFFEPTTAHPNGLTTIPEQWDRGSSQNHMILAQIEEWFHTGLAGIRQAPGSIGYKSVIIQPKVVGDLTHVQGRYRSLYGEISSEWTKTDDGRWLRLGVTIPANTTAEVWVPLLAGSVKALTPGAVFLRNDSGYAVYQVGSGTYNFVSGGYSIWLPVVMR